MQEFETLASLWQLPHGVSLSSLPPRESEVATIIGGKVVSTGIPTQVRECHRKLQSDCLEQRPQESLSSEEGCDTHLRASDLRASEAVWAV